MERNHNGPALAMPKLFSALRSWGLLQRLQLGSSPRRGEQEKVQSLLTRLRNNGSRLRRTAERRPPSPSHPRKEDGKNLTRPPMKRSVFALSVWTHFQTAGPRRFGCGVWSARGGPTRTALLVCQFLCVRIVIPTWAVIGDKLFGGVDSDMFFNCVV